MQPSIKPFTPEYPLASVHKLLLEGSDLAELHGVNINLHATRSKLKLLRYEIAPN